MSKALLIIRFNNEIFVLCREGSVKSSNCDKIQGSLTRAFRCVKSVYMFTSCHIFIININKYGLLKPSSFEYLVQKVITEWDGWYTDLLPQNADLSLSFKNLEQNIPRLWYDCFSLRCEQFLFTQTCILDKKSVKTVLCYMHSFV